jgi:glutamine cyclotransferase
MLLPHEQTIYTKGVLMQNQHLAPSTQQAEQSWLNTRAGSEVCQSIFLKLTKDEKIVR